MPESKEPLNGSPDDGARTVWHSGAAMRLCRIAPDLLAFVKEFADQECYEDPGEYPGSGESGKAPCVACRAKKLLAAAKQGK